MFIVPMAIAAPMDFYRCIWSMSEMFRNRRLSVSASHQFSDRVMSDTAPKNQDALTSGHAPPNVIREPRRGEVVWRMEKDGAILSCELLDDSHVGAGWEVALRKDDELIVGRRCGTRALADDVAQTFRQDHLRTGWIAIEADRRKDLI